MTDQRTWALAVAEFMQATKQINESMADFQKAIDKLNYIIPAPLEPGQFAIRMKPPH